MAVMAWSGPGPKHHVSVKYDLPLSQIDSRLVVVLHQRKISLIIMPNASALRFIL